MATTGGTFQFRELSTGSFRDSTTGRFIPNPIGIALIANGPQMKAMLLAEAERVLDAAKQLARTDAYDTGDYYRGLKSAVGSDPGKKTSLARVNAFDWKSHWIEFGAGPSPYRGGHPFPAKHILERAAEACGYQLKADKNARRIFGSGMERVTRLKGR